MSLPQTLLKIALLGTERQTQAPQGNADLQALLAQLYPQGQVPSGEAREAAFFSALALSQQYHAVGSLPTVFNGTLPPRDDKTDLTCIPAAAELHLSRLLNDSQLRPLLPTWLAAASAQTYRVPVKFIPALMEQAQQSRALRPAISAVLGQRGQWLAQQHPEWQRLLTFVTDADTTTASNVWEEGNTAQRLGYLQQIRQTQADEARTQLQAVWKQEAATVRQELLSALRINLSLADEAWLESCLDDRSKGVRQVAAELLGALPDSAFGQRHLSRLQQWLTLEQASGLLNKLTGQRRLNVDLPETWDKTWLRDGIEEKPPQGKGAKAWWLEQALSYLPPSVWTQQWQITPHALLALTAKHDWRKVLLDGWQQALIRYPNADWAADWLLHVNCHTDGLWEILPPAQAETLASTLLRETDTNTILPMLVRLPHAWSLAFSTQVIQTLQQHIQRPDNERRAYLHYHVIQHIATQLHTDSVNTFSSVFADVLQNELHPFQRGLQDTLFTLRFRADMLQTLAQ